MLIIIAKETKVRRGTSEGVITQKNRRRGKEEDRRRVEKETLRRAVES